MSYDDTLTTNLGELFKTDIQGLKSKTKFDNLQDQITIAEGMLKDLDYSGTINDEKNKVQKIIDVLYKGNAQVNQYGYLDKKRTVVEVVAQAFYIVVSKSENLQKAKNDFQSEMDGY